MLSGIRTAINFPTPAARLRSVVLLTDGYIGNENEILSEVQQHLQPGNRLYSFGAGSSINRFLLNRIASLRRRSRFSQAKAIAKIPSSQRSAYPF